MEDELLTVQQVAREFGVTRQAVMHWITKGYLTARRPSTPEGIRTYWLVSRSAVIGFVPPRRRKGQKVGLSTT